MTGKLLSTKEAAVYVGLAVVTVKWHIYHARDLVPDGQVAKTLYFTKANLDDFKARIRSAHQPRRGAHRSS